MGGLPFLLPLMLQEGLAFTSVQSGLLTCPVAIAMILFRPLVTGLLRRYGFKKVLLVNTSMIGMITMSFALVDSQTPIWVIAMIVTIYGGFATIQYGTMNNIVYVDVGQKLISKCTSIVTTMQQLTNGLGIAIAALILRFFWQEHGYMSHINISAFYNTFLVMGLLSVFPCLVYLRFNAEDGNIVSGHNQSVQKSLAS
jgi:MFS family permease